MSHVARSRVTFVGIDVARDSISVAVLAAGSDRPVIDRVTHDEPSVRRFVGRLGPPHRLHACYEAGPTGYGLARLLGSMGVRCDVVAPALIPKAAGDRVKTDDRDASRLARLLRLGELTAIRVPTYAEEGVRDLSRARFDLISDRRRARQRLSAHLLRHGRVWRQGSSWTLRHLEWLRAQRFDDAAVQATYDHYLGVVTVRDADVTRISADLDAWFDHELFHDRCSRLACYRGIDRLGSLVLVSEVCDWHRFDTARKFMGFCGLVPTEYSSGNRSRRGPITKAGNVQVRTQLIEGAWAYRHRALVSRHLEARQHGVHPDTIARAWAAQQRLCRRFRTLAARKQNTTVVATAVARELAGFVWAEMTT